MLLAGTYASPEIRQAAKQIQPDHRQVLRQPRKHSTSFVGGQDNTCLMMFGPPFLARIRALAHPGSDLQPGLLLL